MKDEELREYLINFAEKTLNECEVFSKVFGKDFVRKRLEQNLDMVYTYVHNEQEYNINFYCMDKNSIYNNCILLFSNDNSGCPLTITDIENNRKLQCQILHELIHAIFRKTKEECEALGIEDGTGIHEFYNNGTELGRGLNEGLTEWICYKAGYGSLIYPAETNIIRLLELALTKERIMMLANGDIKGNISHLLQMTETECRYILGLVDKINQIEMDVYKGHGSMVSTQDDMLDKSISHFEATIFEKYFADEIIQVQNAETISEETMNRLDNLYFCIKGGQTSASQIFNSRFPLQFKREIYPELMQKYHKSIMQLSSKNSVFEETKTNLPVVYKKNWFQRLKEMFNQKFMKKNSVTTLDTSLLNHSKKVDMQNFKNHISDMSNYLENFGSKHKTKNTNYLDIPRNQESEK